MPLQLLVLILTESPHTRAVLQYRLESSSRSKPLQGFLISRGSDAKRLRRISYCAHTRITPVTAHVLEVQYLVAGQRPVNPVHRIRHMIQIRIHVIHHTVRTQQIQRTHIPQLVPLRIDIRISPQQNTRHKVSEHREAVHPLVRLHAQQPVHHPSARRVIHLEVILHPVLPLVFQPQRSQTARNQVHSPIHSRNFHSHVRSVRIHHMLPVVRTLHIRRLHGHIRSLTFKKIPNSHLLMH